MKKAKGIETNLIGRRVVPAGGCATKESVEELRADPDYRTTIEYRDKEGLPVDDAWLVEVNDYITTTRERIWTLAAEVGEIVSVYLESVGEEKRPVYTINVGGELREIPSSYFRIAAEHCTLCRCSAISHVYGLPVCQYHETRTEDDPRCPVCAVPRECRCERIRQAGCTESVFCSEHCARRLTLSEALHEVARTANGYCEHFDSVARESGVAYLTDDGEPPKERCRTWTDEQCCHLGCHCNHVGTDKPCSSPPAEPPAEHECKHKRTHREPMHFDGRIDVHVYCDDCGDHLGVDYPTKEEQS